MAAHYYYKPLPKNTIKIEDITFTSNAQNQEILHKLKQNDPSFSNLYISNGSSRGMNSYVPGEEEDVSWLGNFLGKNSYVKELVVKTSIDDSFYKGLSCNKSIQKIHILHIDLSDGQIFHVLDPFKQKHTSNLNEISISYCTFDTEGALQLSLALGSFNSTSLKQIMLSHNQIVEVDGRRNNVITALGSHTNLETLRLPSMNIGRTECTALSTMIRWSTTELQKLDLYDNNIDDDSVKSLVHAIGGSKLVRLSLSRNHFITLEGYKTLSNLLERPESTLEKLLLHENNIDSTALAIFANSLANNSTLKTLGLADNTITDDGWLPFSELLCDTSSINNTYLSNHTLRSIGKGVHPAHHIRIVSSLTLNGRADKGEVAMIKILGKQSLINVYPFFEWELKVLPLLVTWFAKAAACTARAAASVYFEKKIKVMKLNAIYDFVREMPMIVGCCYMGRNGKRRSDRRPGFTDCNCSCVIS